MIDAKTISITRGVDKQLFEYHPVIGYRFIPNLQTRVQHEGGGYLVKTNSIGFRSEIEFNLKKEEGLKRILLFGDSFTEGDGVSNKKRYSDILMNILPSTEVFNFGLRGTGTDQQYLIYKQFAKDIEHDLVMIVVYIENIRRVNAKYRFFLNARNEKIVYEKPYFEIENDCLVLKNTPVNPSQYKFEDLPNSERNTVDTGVRTSTLKQTLRRVGLIKAAKSVVNLLPLVKKMVKRMGLIKLARRITGNQQYIEYNNPKGKEWLLLKAVLIKWISELDKPVLLVPLPTHEYVDEHGDYKAIEKRFKEFEGIPNVTLYSPYKDLKEFPANERRKFRFNLDTHPTPLGHEIYAKAFKPKLKQFSKNIQNKAMDKYILGISAFYHDSAAAIIKNNEIIAAVQEERFSRKKHDPRFPYNAINYCLSEAFIESEDIDMIVFYDNPILTFDRIIKNFITAGEKGYHTFEQAINSSLGTKWWIEDYINKALGSVGKEGKIYFCGHHMAHAASAYYPSPFNEAAVITVDGVGEWQTTTLGFGKQEDLKIIKEINYPHSLGLLYSAFTYYCGFKINSGEYKLMGLAPYGKPKYTDDILKNLIDVKEDGSYHLNMKYFGYIDSDKTINENFEQLFAGKARKPESKITQKEMDIAASIQKITEDVMVKLAKHIKKITGSDNLCMAGGVALNCVANGKILKENIFKNIWIQPSSGDAGGSLGGALLASYQHYGLKKPEAGVDFDLQKGSYLGPSYSSSEIEAFLTRNLYPHRKFESSAERNIELAKDLDNGKILGYFNGRMEFGPRSLGARSILGDARNKEMQSKMNLKIKFRESFRPFAPAVLTEDINKYFELDQPSPYMLLVAPVKENRRLPIEENIANDDMIFIINKERSDVPAITHVDFSARIQTVNKQTNTDFYDLIAAFKNLTGSSCIVNTSFNVRGEPIVCSPGDAYLCFMRTDIDILILENYVLYKKDQKPLPQNEDWKVEYELD